MTLDDIAKQYKTDKSSLEHGYTRIYDGLFKDSREAVQNVLEIGIGSGASLRMWRDYFPKATIYGLDLVTSKLIYDEDRIFCEQADQRSRGALIATANKIGQEFDLIVDDGSHETLDQETSFKALYPFLKPGGIYVIEDLFLFDGDNVREEGIQFFIKQ